LREPAKKPTSHVPLKCHVGVELMIEYPLVGDNIGVTGVHNQVPSVVGAARDAEVEAGVISAMRGTEGQARVVVAARGMGEVVEAIGWVGGPPGGTV
jgi:hypothetical protein